MFSVVMTWVAIVFTIAGTNVLAARARKVYGNWSAPFVSLVGLVFALWAPYIQLDEGPGYTLTIDTWLFSLLYFYILASPKTPQAKEVNSGPQ